uniref:Uncharacterized protein n=1 Tax=Strix occidentalis caurina TaxID=311401 RepID=A0A8D0F5Y6_STROC
SQCFGGMIPLFQHHLPHGPTGSSLKHLSRQLPGCAGGVGMRREGDWRLEGTLCPAKGVETAAMARASDGADPCGCLRDLPPLGRVTAAPKLKEQGSLEESEVLLRACT